jgi:hypothetical protein
MGSFDQCGAFFLTFLNWFWSQPHWFTFVIVLELFIFLIVVFQPTRWLLPILGFYKTQLLFSKKSSISLATFKNQIDQKFYKLDFDISKFNNWKWWLGDLFLKLCQSPLSSNNLITCL